MIACQSVIDISAADCSSRPRGTASLTGLPRDNLICTSVSVRRATREESQRGLAVPAPGAYLVAVYRGSSRSGRDRLSQELLFQKRTRSTPLATSSRSEDFSCYGRIELLCNRLAHARRRGRRAGPPSCQAPPPVDFSHVREKPWISLLHVREVRLSD